jgi:hypothetical protein
MCCRTCAVLHTCHRIDLSPVPLRELRARIPTLQQHQCVGRKTLCAGVPNLAAYSREVWSDKWFCLYKYKIVAALHISRRLLRIVGRYVDTHLGVRCCRNDIARAPRNHTCAGACLAEACKRHGMSGGGLTLPPKCRAGSASASDDTLLCSPNGRVQPTNSRAHTTSVQ